jgi:hypothetical protein
METVLVANGQRDIDEESVNSDDKMIDNIVDVTAVRAGG